MEPNEGRLNQGAAGSSEQNSDYESPSITTYSHEQFMAALGPAQGYASTPRPPGAGSGNIRSRNRLMIGLD